ncbi:hypothetical protein S83_015317, partial [Arachis hypogaea]
MEREDEDATQERRLRELKELGVTLPKDAFELIFVFLQEILANRHSAHRKLQYISKLDRSVTSFQ